MRTDIQNYYETNRYLDNIIEDHEYLKRDSVIMKVKKDNTWFVCNRNSDDFDNIFNDKYVKFWEVNNISYLNFSNCDNIEFLCILPLDNYNKRHQTILNKYKQKYIDELLIKNIELSNKDMTGIKKQYRNIYYEQWKEFLETLNHIEHLEEKIYDYSKKIFYAPKDKEWFYEMTRDTIWKHKKWNKEQKVIFIILRDYIRFRKYTLKSKYPFDKGNIKNKIKRLIRNFYKP